MPFFTRALPQVNMLLPGMYAWLTTVGLPAMQRSTGPSPRTTAFTALGALLFGPFLAPTWPRVGRLIGVVAFVGLSVLTWILLGPAISIGRLEPIRAALGGVGWALFALGWGALRDVGSVPEDDPHAIRGVPLQARGRLPAGAVAILAIGVFGALPPLYLAWRVTRPDHALFAHAAAVLSAIALLFAAAHIAVERGAYKLSSSPRQRFNHAARALGVLALLLGIGFVWLLLR